MRLQLPPKSLLLISIVVAIAGIGVVGSVPPAVGDQSQTRLPVIREVPNDPPGIPARPVPGALPAPPVQFGSFTSIQANVGPGGVNIMGDAANEPSIAVDPTFPNRMAIGWRQFDTITSDFREAGYAYSNDGGRSWTFPGVLENDIFRSDPVLDFDAQGNFYYSSLRYENPDFWCDVFKSWNGGMTWAPKIYAYGGDKQWITVDRSGGIGDGIIYQAWSIAGSCCNDSTFTRSIDGGTHFSIPQEIPNNPVWGTMAVGSGGELYLAGIDINAPGTFYVAKSTDANDPASTPSFDFVTQVEMLGNVRYFSPGSPNPEGLLGQVWIAVDRTTGPTAGYVYLLASVDAAGPDPLEIHFARSTDGGVTWSAPVRVNDDPSLSNWQWFGTMAVAPNGRIDAVWNDTRNTGQANLSQLYYAHSTDGGASWSVNQPVSPIFDSYLGWPQQAKLGDYYDMISDDVGAHVAWAATFNEEQDVYYLRIGDYDCNTNGVGDSLDIAHGTSPDLNSNGIPDECDDVFTAVVSNTATSYRLHQNVPNPFNPTTTIRFDLPPGGGPVKLQVFDVTGRLIRTLVDGFETGGIRSVRWNGTDAKGNGVVSGLYFYRLEASGYTETRKLILLK
ncbi:MAG: T9SS type A sorting domain-containing protein [Candidatus Latescibacterota bacterium]|nr:MAG: T9SS type A sorting domain-containing protein [Candidatus Latescibacterota bacterium]